MNDQSRHKLALKFIQRNLAEDFDKSLDLLNSYTKHTAFFDNLKITIHHFHSITIEGSKCFAC